MELVIIDTNFLLIPATLKVDIFTQLSEVIDYPHELAILDLTIKELNNIMANQRGKYKQAAKLTLSLAKAKNLTIIKTKASYLDAYLIELSKTKKITVATQDKALKDELKQNKANIVVLRQKKYLELYKYHQ